MSQNFFDTWINREGAEAAQVANLFSNNKKRNR